MKAKITDVAQKANVSISTVSHVLNHTRFVSEETRKKVMDAVEELGYSPDASGRTFRTGKKMMIGLVVPDITNSVFAALIEDVDDVISKQGYNLVISNTRDCLKMEKQALRNLASGVVDGIVIASTSEDFQTIKRQIPDKFPMIFMDRVLPDRNYDSVILDCHHYQQVSCLYKRSEHHQILPDALPSCLEFHVVQESHLLSHWEYM